RYRLAAGPCTATAISTTRIPANGSLMTAPPCLARGFWHMPRAGEGPPGPALVWALTTPPAGRILDPQRKHGRETDGSVASPHGRCGRAVHAVLRPGARRARRLQRAADGSAPAVSAGPRPAGHARRAGRRLPAAREPGGLPRRLQ